MGYAAAVVLAAVFAWAAVAKLRDRAGTARTFTALGLPARVAIGVPVAELALAAALVVVPGWGAAAALAVLAGFTTFLARGVRRGVVAPCNCFGSSGGAPVSWVELLRNGLLAIAAAVALTAARPARPSLVSAVSVALAVLVARLLLTAAEQRQRRDAEGLRPGTPAPDVPGVRWPALLAFHAPECPRCAADRAVLGSAHIVLLDASTRAVFDAYRVRATPYYVEVGADGAVRWRGAELKAAQRAR